MALLLLVLGGGYVAVGNYLASSRVSSAESAIASIHKIDFTTTISEIGGGFNIFGFQSPSDAKAFQTAVQQFVASVGTDSTNIAADAAKAKKARNRLDDQAWLTLFNQGSRGAAATRVGHAEQALVSGAQIAEQLQQDGQFFHAYAASLVDFANYGAAVDANDATGEVAPIEQAKSDLAIALTLVNGPGLPTDLPEFITSLQAVANDIVKAIFTSDQAGYDAALKQITIDETALGTIDTSGFDASILAFYHPLIATYERELQQASD